MVPAVVSFFLPGLGQALNGQTTKGGVIFVGAVMTGFLCGLAGLFAAYDAYKIAERRARGESVGPWQFM
jgi:Pyruvate/2-oxoacid:ferredoxin oxidoreductase gamma subunit